MAVITPSTNIQFFNNLGLSPAYENSLYFESTAAKDAYFNNQPKAAVFANCYYQREHRGYIRVEGRISVLYKVDYMRFQNPDFENKWFYAFVMQVNYINNNTTEVQYALDPLMTWMGDFDLKQCFVNRMHVRNDSIGANIADEGLPLGEYINENVTVVFDTANEGTSIMVWFADPGGNGAIQGGIYGGCFYQTFKSDDIAGVNKYIQQLVEGNYSDNIVAIIEVPSTFIGRDVKTVHSIYNKPYSNIAGYVPKNKKLYCYPYKYLEVDNQEGGTQTYAYEYFDNLPPNTSSGSYDLAISGSINTKCELLLYPMKYKGQQNTQWELGKDVPMYSLGMSHFPQCSWNIDEYKAWLAQKNAYFPMQRRLDAGEAYLGGSGIKNLAAQAGGERVGGRIGENLGISSEISKLIGSGVEAIRHAPQLATSETGPTLSQLSIWRSNYENLIINEVTPGTPDNNKGEQSTDVLFGLHRKGFVLREKSITRNYALMIDNYFTMYGYAVKQVMKPSMNVRSHFTYIQTTGCNVGGNLPAADARYIEQIFDNGIRFWKNHTEIGNYDLDNSGVVG